MAIAQSVWRLSYGLDGPVSNPGGDEIFHPSRPALGHTQPPVQWIPGLSRRQRQPGRGADPPPPSSAEILERVELYLYSPCVAYEKGLTFVVVRK